jgi:DNA (cytosine-5)-methyltransferase 1
VADTDRGRQRERGECDGDSAQPGERTSRRDNLGGCGDVEQLGDSDMPSATRQRTDSGTPKGADDLSKHSGSGRLNPWSDLVWLPCRDGKSRPTEPGLQPLAARLPGELVPSGDPSESYADASTEARVMRLRGYGNSIVAQVAAEVISSYMDIGNA